MDAIWRQQYGYFSSGLVSSVWRALSSKVRGPGFKSWPGTVDSSVWRALSSKVRGPGFKSWPGTVDSSVTIIMCSALPKLKTSFELNPVTMVNKGPFRNPLGTVLSVS